MNLFLASETYCDPARGLTPDADGDDAGMFGGNCVHGCSIFYPDDDRDGVGRTEESYTGCDPKAPGWVSVTGDCDDSLDYGSSCTEECVVFYVDNDCDGYHASKEPGRYWCMPAGGAFTQSSKVDVDDGNSHCDTDSVDSDADGYCANYDCDDKTDYGRLCFAACNTYYRDADTDGMGVTDWSYEGCYPGSPGWAAVAGDCDDLPGFGGECTDGCDTYYEDADTDGVGAIDKPYYGCSSAGWVNVAGDCDDTSPECRETCDANTDGIHDCLGGPYSWCGDGIAQFGEDCDGSQSCAVFGPHYDVFSEGGCQRLCRRNPRTFARP